MTQQTPAQQTKKVYKPKPVVNSVQTSFLVGIMRAKGYTVQDTIIKIVTALSTVTNFSDISFDEARYLVKRLPNVTKANLDAYMAGEVTRTEIGLPPYKAHRPLGKRNHKEGKA